MAGWSEGGWKNGRRRGVAGKSVWQGGMEEAPENGKESPHSVHANGLIDWLIDENIYIYIRPAIIQVEIKIKIVICVVLI